MRKGIANLRKIGAAVVALFLVVAMVIGLWPSSVLETQAQVSDAMTADTWKQSLGEEVSAQYAGRIWTDKSVYSEDASFELYAPEGEEHPIAKVELGEKDDFLVAYSALATAQAVSGQTQAPVDVVFVVDISGSMDDSMRAADGTNSTRIAETVKALNESIDSLMNMNKNTRVGVVLFSSTASQILPLGRYAKGSRTGSFGQTNYFSLSGTTLYKHVRKITGYDAEGNPIIGNADNGTYSVVGGTNIQMGIYEGMNMLASVKANDVTVNVNGQQLQRYPSLVLLSDGAPTYTSSDSEWWDPENNDDNGPGSGAYYGNGMKALMTGAYMKDAVDRHYGLEKSPNGMTVYTIGMGITGLSGNEQDLAYMTLNPGTYWKDKVEIQGIPAGTYTGNNISFDSERTSSSWNTGISSITCNRIMVDDAGNAKAILTIRRNRNAADISSVTVNGTPYSVTDAGNRNFTVEIPIVLGENTSTTITVTNEDRDSHTYELTANVTLQETTSMAEYISEAWKAYVENGTGTPSVQTNGSQTYTLRHPDTSYDILGTYKYKVLDENDNVIEKEGNALQALVDSYYDADDANSVAAVFEQIVTEIALNTAQVPTAIQAGEALDSTGWVIYEDPLGEYMQFTDVKQIIYGGHQFKVKEVQQGDEKYPTGIENIPEGAKIYVANQHLRDETNFDTEIHSGVYAGSDAADIIVMVWEDASGKQVVSVYIPASAIPVRINTITLKTAVDTDGNEYEYVSDHTNNGTYPVRVVYGVGLKDGVVKEVETADGTVEVVDTDFVSAEYLAKHTNPEDGSVKFYSNYYDGTNSDLLLDGETYTAGNAKVTFVPAATNPFYFLQEDAPIYKDPACTIPATTEDEIEDATIYYYKDTYYYLKDEVTTALTRTGAQLKRSGVVDIGGVWHRNAGTARMNRIVALVTPKTENTTDTAQLYYAPQYDEDHSIEGSTTGHMTVWLGNNGVLTKMGSGVLEISKSVTADEGLTAPIPQNGFEFTVDLADDTNTYAYVVLDTETLEEKEGRGGTITAENRKIYLYDGETARITGLVYDTEYKITEKAVAGYEVTPTQAEGTISVGEVAKADFNNHYRIEQPIEWPTNGELSGTKELKGRVWKESDSFTFLLTPFNDAPLPGGVSDQVAITVTGAGEGIVGTNVLQNFDFGSIRFTKPGVYRYTVVEKEPEANTEIPGISYSRALYRIVITVEDNQTGALVVTETDIQQLYDDHGNALFTYNGGNIVVNDDAQDDIKFVNTYNATTITKVPVAVKAYTDMTGTKPLTSGMFRFRLTPNGILTNGVLDGSDVAIAEVPMPLDASDNPMKEVITSNEGINITFLPIDFTTDDLGESYSTITYRYKLEELRDNPIPGMTYQETPEYIDVTLSLNNDNELVVHASYEDLPGTDYRLPTFVNTYEPDAVTLEGEAALQGTKTLTGRDMKAGEEYTFNISAGDTATEDAIADGSIIQGETTDTVSGGTDGEKKSFDFGKWTFKKPGTYHFTIGEVIPSDATGNVKAGVTYDNHKVNVEIKVEDPGTGKLEATVTYDNSTAANEDAAATTDKAAFVNVYQPKFTGPAVSLNGSKNLTGQTLEAQEFRFAYTTDIDSGSGKAAANATWHYVTNHAGTDTDEDGTYTGSITFLKDVTYTAAGTYTYIIGEYLPEHAILGMTNDHTVYRLVVEVVDDGAGSLTVNSQTLSVSEDYHEAANPTWEPAQEVVFDNFYKPEEVQYQIPVLTKILEGANREVRPDEFKFQRTVLSPKSSDGIILMKDENTEAIQDKDIVTNGTNGDVEFGPVKFTKAGTYVVQMAEVMPTEEDGAHYDMAAGAWVKDGVYYTARPVTATFVVEDNQRGTLTVHVTNVTGSTFVNRYEAMGVLSLQIRKDFAGRLDNEWLETDEFTFAIQAADEATSQAVANEDILLPDAITIGKTTENKTAWFEDIYIYKEGTYLFEIAEDRSADIPGVTYAAPRKLEVKATDQGNGVITVSYDMMDTVDEVQEAPIVFRNVYTPSSTTLSGSANLKVEKTFTGRKNNEWLYTEEYKDTFKFTLGIDDDHADTNTALENGDIVFAGTTLEVTKNNKDNAYFGDITFHKQGLYKFIVQEVDESHKYSYIDYDTTPRYVWVNVVDNKDGTMTASVVASQSDELMFTNTYTATMKEEDAVPLNGTKEMTGRNLKSTDNFEFTITAVTQGAPMPANATVQNNANGEIAFGPIWYQAAGTYVYEIRETGGSAAGVTNAKNVVTATVTVTDNQQGDLIGSVAYSADGFKFVNTYETNPTDPISITAMKKVTPSVGNSYTMEKDDFEFTITLVEVDDQPVTPGESYGNPIADAQVTNDADGNVVFATDVKYTQAGKYEYRIQESDGNLGGMSYSQVVYKVTIDVKDDVATAKLGATITVEEGVKGQVGATEVTGVVTTDGNKQLIQLAFENQYNPTKVTANISGKKVLNVSGNPDVKLQAGDFIFKLQAVDGAPMPTNAVNGVAEVTNNDAGEIVFGQITYMAPGTYKYKVWEEKDDQKGYTYDETICDVTIEIEDQNGELKVIQNTSGTDKVVFDNSYKPDSVTLQGDTAIKGTKILTGRDMKAGEFSFTITPAKDNSPMPKEATVKNAKDGSFSFEPITFDTVGEYTYTITEQKGTLGGVTYDEQVYTVKVTVTDEGGYLAAEVEYPQNGVGFENAYKATVSAKVSLDAKKKLTGRELKVAEFAFQLIDKDGKVVATAKNSSNGAILFDALTFDKVGEYEYRVVEVKGDAKGVTYDDTEYVVTIKVVDDLNGSLKADTSVTKDGKAIDAMEFVNVYKDSAPQTSDTVRHLPTMVMFLLAVGSVAVVLKKRRVTK